MAQLLKQWAPSDTVRWWIGDIGTRLFCCNMGHADASEAVRCAYARPSASLRLYHPTSGGGELSESEAVALVVTDAQRHELGGSDAVRSPASADV